MKLSGAGAPASTREFLSRLGLHDVRDRTECSIPMQGHFAMRHYQVKTINELVLNNTRVANALYIVISMDHAARTKYTHEDNNVHYALEEAFCEYNDVSDEIAESSLAIMACATIDHAHDTLRNIGSIIANNPSLGVNATLYRGGSALRKVDVAGSSMSMH